VIINVNIHIKNHIIMNYLFVEWGYCVSQIIFGCNYCRFFTVLEKKNWHLLWCDIYNMGTLESINAFAAFVKLLISVPSSRDMMEKKFFLCIFVLQN